MRSISTALLLASLLTGCAKHGFTLDGSGDLPSSAPDVKRWHRAVYLDSTPRDITVYFDDMTPRGATSSPRPIPANVRSILFVVDTVNTPLGGNGTFWIDNVRYAR